MLYAISEYDKVKDFIIDLADQYNMEVVDVVNLLQILRNYGDGKPIMVPPRVGSRWIRKVPSPYDENVNFDEAWKQAQADAVIGYQLLMSNPSFEEVLDVQLNAYRWLRFWSIRDPDPGWRIIYEGTADDMAYGMKRCRQQCAMMNNPKAQLVLEKLHP